MPQAEWVVISRKVNLSRRELDDNDTWFDCGASMFNVKSRYWIYWHFQNSQEHLAVAKITFHNTYTIRYLPNNLHFYNPCALDIQASTFSINLHHCRFASLQFSPDNLIGQSIPNFPGDKSIKRARSKLRIIPSVSKPLSNLLIHFKCDSSIF